MQWRTCSISGKWWSDNCQKESWSERNNSGPMPGKMPRCNKTYGSSLWTLECSFQVLYKRSYLNTEFVIQMFPNGLLNGCLHAIHTLLLAVIQVQYNTLESVRICWADFFHLQYRPDLHHGLFKNHCSCRQDMIKMWSTFPSFHFSCVYSLTFLATSKRGEFCEKYLQKSSFLECPTEM